jgi:two-component system chemotaxis response regulator CheB
MPVGTEQVARAVALGASAGAVEALGQILPALPRDFPWPVLVVVHLPASGKSLLARLFEERCALRVLEVEDKQPLEAGVIYFCPPDYHLLVEASGELSLSIDGPMRFSRPSIDVLFESVADVFGAGAIGVVLSGANEDGARGLAEIAARGGTTMVQTPDSAQAQAMPTAALLAAPHSVMGNPQQLAVLLTQLALGAQGTG